MTDANCGYINSTMKFEFAEAPRPQHVDPPNWYDWTWQLRTSLKSEKDFAGYFELSAAERTAFRKGSEIFNIRTTPYYASLASRTNEHDPIRKILAPHAKELFDPKQAQLDPLGETRKANQPTARIIHRYSDRVLFLVTDICSV